jgi:hypothetical protein
MSSPGVNQVDGTILALAAAGLVGWECLLKPSLWAGVGMIGGMIAGAIAGAPAVAVGAAHAVAIAASKVFEGIAEWIDMGAVYSLKESTKAIIELICNLVAGVALTVSLVALGFFGVTATVTYGVITAMLLAKNIYDIYDIVEQEKIEPHYITILNELNDFFGFNRP